MWRGKEYSLRWIWFMLLTLLCKQSPEIFGQYNNYTCVWLCVCVRMCWLQWKHCLQKDIQTLCCGNDISWCIVEWCWLYRNDLVQSWKIRQRSMLLSFCTKMIKYVNLCRGCLRVNFGSTWLDSTYWEVGSRSSSDSQGSMLEDRDSEGKQ